MKLTDRIRDARNKRRAVKARNFAKELSNKIMLSPICSDYENIFAQVRPLIDEMKMIMPYGVGRNGARLPEQRTPELFWLKNPNDEMGWSEFADLMFATWLTESELDIHVWRKPNGQVEAYTVLPPETRIYLGDGVWKWQVVTDQGIEVLTEDEVMRLRFSRSPRNHQMGVSPASSIRVWAQIDDLISQYQRAYFENGAVPATITFIAASTEQKYKEVREDFERKLKGADNHNKTVFVWRPYNRDTGDTVDQVEVKTIQGNNSTLAIKEIVSIVNDRLNKAIGVSNFILGDDSSAKYDNAELSDHQFTKRRVLPALVSFWNQFQHELERIVGGLGYTINFDLEIPELTERNKAKAEIARVRAESLIDLISAGASGDAAVLALGLGDNWKAAATGIYASALQGKLNAPKEITYSKPKELPAPKAQKAECHHSVDALPEMTAEEKKAYQILIDLAEAIRDGKDISWDKTIDEMVDVLVADANRGAKDGAKALELLTDDEVASEIAKAVTGGEVYASERLSERIRARTSALVAGYGKYTEEVFRTALEGSEELTAQEIKERLTEVLPRTRAELIARCETLYAIRSGRLEQDQKLADKYSLDVNIIWRTSKDDDVCAVCAAMEGTKTKLGQAFKDSAETLDGETVYWEQSEWNDGGKIPDAHPNCRCYFDEELV